MPCVLTQGYNLDCRDSFGGVKAIYLIERANVTATPETAGAATAVTKAATKLFFKYNIEAYTAEGTESLTANRANSTVMVKQTVNFPINKMTVSVRNEILLLAQNRLVVVVEDNNGTGYLYGKDFGMMLTASNAKTGVAPGDRNGYELSFESDEKAYGLFLSSSIITTLTVAGV